MQKNFIVEVYESDGKRTYIVRKPNEQTKGFDAVLITESASEVAEFLSTCKITD